MSLSSVFVELKKLLKPYENDLVCKEDDAEKAVGKVEENSKLIAENLEKPVKLTEAEVVNDTFNISPAFFQDSQRATCGVGFGSFH